MDEKVIVKIDGLMWLDIGGCMYACTNDEKYPMVSTTIVPILPILPNAFFI